jgi:peptidoglycan/xylan/chitin deacetylase (PgdA/CDA1 family)
MSRFYITAILALLIGALALAFHNFLFLAVMVIVFLAITGLGVALPQLSFFGKFICCGKNSSRRVALTFDDGPDARSTPQLLDFLREEKIAATFFCIGKNVAANPELAARILRDGHLLENHSYSHSNFINFYSTARLQDEMARTQAVIGKISGVAPKFYRPPVGLSNPNTFRAARNLDLKVTGWTIRSFDTITVSPKKIVARISRQLKPGAIILLHDGNIPAARLLPTVKLLLATLCERGYDVVRLDKMIE